MGSIFHARRTVADCKDPNYSDPPDPPEEKMVCASCGSDNIRWDTDSWCHYCGEFRDAVPESEWSDSLGATGEGAL